MNAVPDRALATSRRSLRHVLAIILVVGMLLPSLLLMAWTVHSTNTHARPRLLNAAMEQYAHLLTPALMHLLWNLDREGARSLLERLVDDSNILRVRVFDEHGRLWLDVATPEIATQERALQSTYPLVYGATAIGSFVIDISDAPIRKNLMESLRQQLLLFGMQLFMALSLVLWFFSRRVFQPLQILGDAARQMGEGKLDQPVPVLRDDELGRLALQVEHMRQALNHSFAEVSAFNLELEQRVEKRTMELAQANMQLECTIAHLNTAQDELVKNAKLVALGSLVAGISHELNTPIGNALTVSTTLEAQVHEFACKLDQPMRRSDLQEFMSTIGEGSTLVHSAMLRAAELIRHFKQLAVDQTSSRRREFSLADSVSEVMASIQPQLRKTRHSLTMDVPDDLTLDSFPGPLAQIMLNLIDNALQHAFEEQPEGHMHLHAERVQNPALPPSLLLVFSDNGSGIAPEHLPRIFDPFFTTRLGKGGSGLGLNIVYNIVTDILGGNIKVESVPGQGSRFIITLPLNAPHRA